MSNDLLSDLPEWPRIDHAAFGPVESRPLGKIQRLTARFLGRNWVKIPHVTQQDEVDITDFEARRVAWNAANPDRKVTPVAPLAKAMAQVLQDYPKFNCSLEADGETIVQKGYLHIGIAIETPNGLVVGVVRDVDKKSVVELGAEITAIADKARTKGLSMMEMTGASMTLSSLGHIGGTGFTPIINAPEVAILGVSKTQIRPMPADDGGISWRKMLPLSLSYDHRVVNGGDAARFTQAMEVKLAALTVFDA
jgi:pyruvate dehydrogenase E2 component (dihydrolipoamide acetyltransferase)